MTWIRTVRGAGCAASANKAGEIASLPRLTRASGAGADAGPSTRSKSLAAREQIDEAALGVSRDVVSIAIVPLQSSGPCAVVAHTSAGAAAADAALPAFALSATPPGTK